MGYPVGAFFVVSVDGAAGFGIGVGQALAGAPSRYEHAGMIVAADGDTVEAQPGGARYGHLADYGHRPMIVCDGPVQDWLAGRQQLGLPNAETYIRGVVAGHAVALLGRPYSVLDYFALALLHLGLPAGWARKRVQSSGHLICSQLVDLVYQLSGIRLFPDGREPGDVMPSDLAAWAEDWRHANG